MPDIARPTKMRQLSIEDRLTCTVCRKRRGLAGQASYAARRPSQRGDDNAWHDVAAHLRDRLEAAAIIEDSNGAPFANIACEGILGVDEHELFPGMMQLPLTS